MSARDIRALKLVLVIVLAAAVVVLVGWSVQSDLDAANDAGAGVEYQLQSDR